MGTLGVLKHGVLLFWAVWFTIVFVTNLIDGLKGVHLMGNRWKFASGNWAAIKEITAIYKTLAWLAPILFAGTIAWAGVSTILMWRALVLFAGVGDPLGLGAVYAAFAASLGLFAAFLIADEIFIAPAYEIKHLCVFLALLVSMLVLGLLPDGF